MLERGIGIDFDDASFRENRIIGVTHKLMEHPLLQLPALMELGKRLKAKGSVRYHNADAKPGTDFSTAPDTHKPKMSIEETLEKIQEAEAWMALHNVQTDPLYRTLVSDVLEDIRPRVERIDPGMHDYAGWIFITSPNAITPYHMDHENNFILQIRGKKEIHVWDPMDRDVVTERCLELFHAKQSRELVTYREDLQSRAKVFHAEPGMGAYMPQTAPHWVQNGNGVSVTMSFTYYTDATERRRRLYRGNQKLRALGVDPRPIGRSIARDSVADAAWRGYAQLRAMMRGQKRPPNPTFEQT